MLEPSLTAHALQLASTLPKDERQGKERFMQRRVVFGIVALTMLAAGCATQWDVEEFSAPDANLAARQSFHWRGGEIGTAGPIDPAASAAADQQIRDVVVAALLNKGYAQASNATGAQMTVGYQVADIRRFVEAGDRRVGAPSPNTVLSPSEIQPPPASALPREMLVRDGSVMVFIEDPATGKLIWRGVVNAELRVKSSEEAVRLVTQMAQEVASRIPARGGTP
jgi:hypothetical protein